MHIVWSKLWCVKSGRYPTTKRSQNGFFTAHFSSSLSARHRRAFTFHVLFIALFSVRQCASQSGFKMMQLCIIGIWNKEEDIYGIPLCVVYCSTFSALGDDGFKNFTKPLLYIKLVLFSSRTEFKYIPQYHTYIE
jgi:hypothetical protein